MGEYLSKGGKVRKCEPMESGGSGYFFDELEDSKKGLSKWMLENWQKKSR